MARLLSFGLLTAALCASAAGAWAQAAAPAPDAPLGGPQIPGLCLLSQQAVYANAKVGVAATARLKQLADQAQAEVNAVRQPIEADTKTLEQQRASLKPADLAQRQDALNTRLKALQALADQRSRQIVRTRETAAVRIATEARPVIAQVYKTRGCGLLFDRNSVLGGNMAGDITAAVVQALDAKITTIAFDLEPADAAAPPAR